MASLPPDGARFDYIVVGAGSAGSIVANRLTRDPKIRVMLVEAGGEDRWIWLHIPAGYLFAIGNPRVDWCMQTEAEAGLNGRSLAYPRGKVIGGSTAINGMIYMRGQARDYDGWRQMGLMGWGWADVLPYFLAHEDHAEPPSALHSQGGEWRIENPRIKWEVLDAFADAASEAGIPKVADFNGGDNEGSSYFQVNQKRGRRWSAARGFLDPIRNRPNFTLALRANVASILFEGREARGISYEAGGEIRRAFAEIEVILSAGAVATPKLLQLSGIGQADLLARHGIAPIHVLPGVGENLQDHLQLRPIYRVEGVRTLNTDYHNMAKRAWMGVNYFLFRRGPLTMAPSQLGIFAKTGPEFETANVQFHVQPLSLDKFGDPLHDFPAITPSVCNLRPTSRGHIRIKTNDFRQQPAIAPNYLSTPEDRHVAVQSLRLVRRIIQQPAFARFRPQEFRPGAHIIDDDGLAKAAGDIGTTIFHPVGTAKMGLASDPLAVVDERLRVHGIGRLRVIDASVMPRITSGNTNAPTMMIAEKGAAMLIEDCRR